MTSSNFTDTRKAVRELIRLDLRPPKHSLEAALIEYEKHLTTLEKLALANENSD